MIELARHIEILLLDNDCVIVPGFGGFITHHVSARHIEEENLFLPPYRTIGFNPAMKLNDGLLVQSYMIAYDASYPEAVRIVNSRVEKLESILHKEGEYELHGIGLLRENVQGQYTFKPLESGINHRYMMMFQNSIRQSYSDKTVEKQISFYSSFPHGKLTQT